MKFQFQFAHYSLSTWCGGVEYMRHLVTIRAIRVRAAVLAPTLVLISILDDGSSYNEMVQVPCACIECVLFEACAVEPFMENWLQGFYLTECSIARITRTGSLEKKYPSSSCMKSENVLGNSNCILVPHEFKCPIIPFTSRKVFRLFQTLLFQAIWIIPGGPHKRFPSDKNIPFGRIERIHTHTLTSPTNLSMYLCGNWIFLTRMQWF